MKLLLAALVLAFTLTPAPASATHGCIPAETYVRPTTPRAVVNRRFAHVPYEVVRRMRREYPLCEPYFGSEVYTIQFTHWQGRVVVYWADPLVGPYPD